jgi:hypothetical protein
VRMGNVWNCLRMVSDEGLQFRSVKLLSSADFCRLPVAINRILTMEYRHLIYHELESSSWCIEFGSTGLGLQ